MCAGAILFRPVDSTPSRRSKQTGAWVNQNIRLVVFVLVAFAILLGFNMWIGPKQAPPTAAAPAATTSVVSTKPTALPTASLVSNRRAVPNVKVAEAAPADVVVDTPLYHAVLTNKGACVKSFELKKYKNRKTKELFNLVSLDGDSPKPLEMGYAAAGDLSGRNWEIEGGARTIILAKGQKAELTFRVGTGLLTIVKTVRLEADRYVFDVNVEVKQTGRGSVPEGTLAVEGPSDLGQEEFTGTNSRASGFRCATFSNEKMNTEKPKRNQESKDVPAPVVWAAMADQFYVSVIMPDAASGSASVRVLRDRHPQVLSEDGKTVVSDTQLWVARPELLFAAPALTAGEGFQRHFILYLGPQELEQLKAMGSQLEKVLDLGMFEFISYYLLLILKWFFSWCHNWGVAIVLLSILVKAVLWWPNHISFKHMSLNQKKMQAMQPKMDAIKKKYANDKTKQNEETMKLYQEANINLTSGCLPMLLQIPIFIALYSALSHSIELRGAPFCLWIQDLSLKDPLFILPLLMGGSMFLQQRLSSQSNPASGSAGQQKFMMWFFPVFLTFMSFQWPAGLLVYWVVTNILSMWQQKMVNKSIKGF